MTVARVFLVCWLFMAGAAFGVDAFPDVPLGYPIYAVLDRFAARGWIDVPYARPLSRRIVAHLLYEVLTRKDRTLTKTEQGILDRYAGEFADDLARLGYVAPADRGGRWGNPLWARRDSAATVSISPFVRQQVVIRRGDEVLPETVSQTYVGGIVEGQYAGLGFRVRHFEAREWASRLHSGREDVLARPIEDVELKGHAVDFREGVFQLVWRNRWVTLDAGKGVVAWGPGRTGNLLLSGQTPTYGLYRLRVSYGRIRYTHIAASLHARPGLIDTTQRWIDNGHVRIFLRQKRLGAHRLEIDLPRGFTLGLHESVIYGDRGFEPLYVLPVTVFDAVQNHLGNQDNVAMGADLAFRPGNGLELYGAWFFDDLAKFSPSAFSNKFAFQFGAFWVDPWRLRDTDVGAEYVRIEPFVYSHNYNINTYENYDELLGHPIGPNSDLWHLAVTHRFSPVFSATFLGERERHGDNPVNPDGTIDNVGGNAELGRRPSDLPVRKFMAGDVETRTRLGVTLLIEPVRDWAFRVAYVHTAGDNILLPNGGRGQTGEHQWTVGLDVNFY